MRKFLDILFFFPLSLFAKESVVSDFEEEPSSIIYDCVDAITGVFSCTERDLEFAEASSLTNMGSGLINGQTNRKNNEIKISLSEKKESSVDLTNGAGDKTHFYRSSFDKLYFY